MQAWLELTLKRENKIDFKTISNRFQSNPVELNAPAVQIHFSFLTSNVLLYHTLKYKFPFNISIFYNCISYFFYVWSEHPYCIQLIWWQKGFIRLLFNHFTLTSVGAGSNPGHKNMYDSLRICVDRTLAMIC